MYTDFSYSLPSFQSDLFKIHPFIAIIRFY